MGTGCRKEEKRGGGYQREKGRQGGEGNPRASDKESG
jgi:hypothetical protein